MDGIALASVVSSGLLGAAGLGASVWTNQRSQSHAERLARDAAREEHVRWGRDRRAELYLDLLVHADRLCDQFDDVVDFEDARYMHSLDRAQLTRGALSDNPLLALPTCGGGGRHAVAA